tara:strand:- start:296 stop:538 length:243 start_codon:yes stop_codon:yes gene_type:complete
MNEDEIAIYIQLWTSVNSYVSVKDKESACEHFLAIINEHVTDLEETASDWAGFDSSIDKVLRNNYIDHDGLDEDDEEDNW